MSDLSPEAKALLETTRRAGGPSAAQRAAMKTAVLAAGLVPTTAAASAGTAAAVKAGGLGLAAKLGIVALLVGVTGGVVVWRVASTSPTPVAPSVSSATAGAPVAQPPPALEVPPPQVEVATPVAPPSVVVARPARAAPQIAEAATPPESEPVPPSTPPPPHLDEATLSREVAALSTAMGAIDAKQYDVALEQVEKYRAAFPTGALATEIKVVEVLALCGLERVDEARFAAALLPANNPSVHRLERSCIKSTRQISNSPATHQAEGEPNP